MIPVILSGGAGSRLWPLSRSLFPKQFLSLIDKNTMMQDTVLRLEESGEKIEPVIVCNESHRFIVAEQLQQINVLKRSIILEPVGRNTAPAIAAAAYNALKESSEGEDPVLLILAADHSIKDTKTFCEKIKVAEKIAAQGKLVTFGINPKSPETGYGYIKAGKKLDSGAYNLEKFVEKPDLETAKKYLESGDFYWNSGMFMFKASVYLDELAKWEPGMAELAKKAVDFATRDCDFIRLDKDSFSSCPSNSIDYAVMEKTEKGVLVPLDAGWSDVGSWSSIWEINPKDENGNVLIGDVVTESTRNSYIRGEERRMVACVGVENLIVVDTKDVVMVASKDKVQDVKTIVNKLQKENRKEVSENRVGYRPWGTYDSIDRDKRYQVKHITVKPGGKLSVQMHHHRAEHWIIVSGTAKVLKGETEHLLTENQSIYIPIGTVHALENPGKIPLELIEVQSGSYLNEDDIIRFEDKYGRC